MAKIKIEDIKQQIEQDNWLLISSEYKNLDSELVFQCPEGHTVYGAWKKFRSRRECPRCRDNKYKNQLNTIQAKKGSGKRILALDQATHICGWSVFDGAELVSYGTFSTQAGDEIARDHTIKNWLLSMIDNWKPDCVALEGIQFQEESSEVKMSVTVFQTLARLQGILMEACHNQKIKYMICPTNTWRHFSNIKGKKRTDKKRSMQILAKQLYDITVSDDEADAIGIGRYAASQNNVEVVNWE